jgi:NADPH:quinone reductase-like Zn-dependent oxidoreductase
VICQHTTKIKPRNFDNENKNPSAFDPLSIAIRLAVDHKSWNMPQQNFGLIRQGTGNAVLKSIPIPELPDDYILVRTIAIALNPTDWTTLDAKGDDGTLVGCDFAGIVEEVGAAVTKPFKKGDRIAGFGHGGKIVQPSVRKPRGLAHSAGNDAKPWTGAFARYITVKGDLQMHIPEGVSFEAAATAAVGFASAGYGLFRSMELAWPGPGAEVHGEAVLVYGGSTATGSIAVQLAKLYVLVVA